MRAADGERRPADALPRHRVTLDEVDAAGVMFGATIIAIAHRAYERALLAIGLDLARVVAERRYALPLARVEADFTHPIRHGDELAFAVGRLRVGERGYAVRIDLDLVGGDRRERAAAVMQAHACIDAASGRVQRLPDAVAAALALLPATA